MDPVLLSKLLAAAIKYTGLPAVEVKDLPKIIPMSPAQISAEICPERPRGCDTLVALFQPSENRILYRNTLNMKFVKDQSFVLHELVHVLQFKVEGVQIFNGCRNIMGSERQAYQAQDRYLGDNGEEYRVGGIYRFMRCEDGKEEPIIAPGK